MSVYQSFERACLLLLALIACLGAGGCVSLFERSSSGVDPGLEESKVRLTEGAITRDHASVTAVLAPDFAWREDEAPLDEAPFDFWDRHRLWGKLEHFSKARTYARGELQVAPKESLKAGYVGPRIAWRRVGSEWRLAYFFAGMTETR